LTLGVGVSLALLVSGRLELAGVAIGLAMGFKYPGVFLLVPLIVAGWKQWRRLAVSAVLVVAAFLASSPFILVHRHQAWHEAFRVQRLARDGWLGFEYDHIAPIAFGGRLWDGLGPALVVCGVGLVIALARRTRTDLILASFVLVYFADLMTLSAHFDRYVLPLIPALGALAGRMRSLAPVTLLLLVVPLTWSIRDTKALTNTDTRVVAHRWVEQHIAPGTQIAADPSTPSFERLRVLSLLLPGPKRDFDANRNIARLRSLGIHDVVVTGAVTDRVLAARDRYPKESAFYDDLRTKARRVFYLAPGDGLAGPWVAVYRL
jgi:4-amino-4-deoxy-L-arabinose transferase-like glycosyltransferase